MSQARRYASHKSIISKLRMSCAATAVLALLPAWHAAAQDRDLLRGEVPDTAINDELLRGQQLRDTARVNRPADPQSAQTPDAAAPLTTPAYQPMSEGAVPDDQEAEQAGESIFEEPETPSSFVDEPPQQSSRGTSTARRRAQEARDRLSPPRTTSSTTSATDRVRPSEASTDATGDEQDEDEIEGVKPVGTVDSETDLTIDDGAERAEAIEALDRPQEENPYAPLGLRLGTFNVYSTLEQGLDWTSNVNYSENPESALRSETTLRLRGESDWAQHYAALEAYGTLREEIDGPNVDDNEAGFDGELRLDITDELRALGTLRYQIKPESASSPVIIEDAISRPIRQTLEGTAGLEKDLGKFRFGVTGGLVDDSYGDADLAGGGVLSQKERDSLLTTVKLRTGYEISPALTPFVEVEAGRRKYDVEVDSAGFRRSADRLALRAGVEVDTGEKLRGEIAVGWLKEKPDDERLDDLSTPSVDANLIWSPQRGTDVTLFASTAVETTNTPDESGSLLYTGRLSIDRQIRANLTGTALVGAAWRDYVGTDGRDLTLTAEASLTWWLNRYMGVTGRARHEQTESNLEGRDTKVDSVFLGVKLQR